MDYGYFIEHCDINKTQFQNVYESKLIAYNLLNSLSSDKNTKNEILDLKKEIEIEDLRKNATVSSGFQVIESTKIKWNSISAIKKEEKWITVIALAVFIP